ncbi:TadE/TadG family type IV pilus assembly protein [Marinobacter sp. C2H3]|uniref:TadE/TadG family type IV pilus assembly protein n=1 Tax=Marinobacter sp. C2H3 TaxID=3119003 RepID=UPI00300F14D7
MNGRRHDRNRGVISLEFVFIFPIIVALIYGAASYGVVFFSKYQMQSAVDNAAASVFSLDRRDSATFASDAVAHSDQVLDNLAQKLPPLVATRIASSRCLVATEDGMELLQCELVADAGASAFLPQVRLFGSAFPPLPKELIASASIAF